MEGATLFIEQFRDVRKPDGEVGNSGLTDIGLLSTALNASKVSTNFKTVAVFKIKPKQAVNNTEKSNTIQ